MTTISPFRRTALALVAAVAVLGIAVGAVLLTRDSSGSDEASAGDEEPGQGQDPGQDPGQGQAGGEGTLAVDLEPLEGVFVEGFDVTLRIFGAGDELVAEREWSKIVPDDAGPEGYYTHVLREAVPAGPVSLVSYIRISPGGAVPPPQEPGCETTVDVAADDTARITLLFQGDADAPDGCAAVAAATAAADELLGMPRGLPAPGFVGLTEDEAETEAAARSWTVRVVAKDGESFIRTEDYITERVNLVVDDGAVTAAARG